MARSDPRPTYGSKRRICGNGYVNIYEPDHPLARRDGYVFEHRKLLFDAGVLTDPALDIHHRNGVKTDNSLENLELVTPSEHPRRHELSGWARENAEKTHCLNGHPLVEGNLYRYDGHRACRRCALDRARDHKRRRRSEAALKAVNADLRRQLECLEAVALELIAERDRAVAALERLQQLSLWAEPA